MNPRASVAGPCPNCMIPLKQSSDSSADFEKLIAEIRPRLRAFLLSLTGSQSAADDLAQDTILVLWEKRDEYDPSGDFKAWAFRIGFFQVQNYRRKLARKQNREIPGDDLFEQIADVASHRHGRDDLDEKRSIAMVTCLGKLRDDAVQVRRRARQAVYFGHQEGVTFPQVLKAPFKLRAASIDS